MTMIARTPTMRPSIEIGDEWFKARQGQSGQQVILCGDALRNYFKLPEEVAELWLVAHDAPIAGGLHVTLKQGFCDWVICKIVDKDVDNQMTRYFENAMNLYLVRLLRLKLDEPKTLYVTCEYR